MGSHQAKPGPEGAELPWTTRRLTGWAALQGITDRGLAPTATHGPPLRGENMLAGLGQSPVSVASLKNLYNPAASGRPRSAGPASAGPACRLKGRRYVFKPI